MSVVLALCAIRLCAASAKRSTRRPPSGKKSRAQSAKTGAFGGAARVGHWCCECCKCWGKCLYSTRQSSAILPALTSAPRRAVRCWFALTTMSLLRVLMQATLAARPGPLCAALRGPAALRPPLPLRTTVRPSASHWSRRPLPSEVRPGGVLLRLHHRSSSRPRAARCNRPNRNRRACTAARSQFSRPERSK